MLAKQAPLLPRGRRPWRSWLAGALVGVACGGSVGPVAAQGYAPGGAPGLSSATLPSAEATERTPTGAWWDRSLGGPPQAPGVAVEPDCFVNLETAVVFPHLSSRLVAPVNLGNAGVFAVSLPNARLDTTVMPTLQIGAYRFGPGYGELALSYRFLATSGTDHFDEGGGTVLHSRLNLQNVSFDYLRTDYHCGADTVLGWHVGARVQVAFFDSQAQTPLSFLQGRNMFWGVGPHAGFSVTHALPEGFELFGRFDAALLTGFQTTQTFVVRTTLPGSGTPTGTLGTVTVGGGTDQEETELAPSLEAQFGVSGASGWLPCSRWRVGYEFDQWFDLGRVRGSSGNLSAHSVFVSWEWSF